MPLIIITVSYIGLTLSAEFICDLIIFFFHNKSVSSTFYYVFSGKKYYSLISHERKMLLNDKHIWLINSTNSKPARPLQVTTATPNWTNPLDPTARSHNKLCRSKLETKPDNAVFRPTITRFIWEWCSWIDMTESGNVDALHNV